MDNKKLKSVFEMIIRLKIPKDDFDAMLKWNKLTEEDFVDALDWIDQWIDEGGKR